MDKVNPSMLTHLTYHYFLLQPSMPQISSSTSTISYYQTHLYNKIKYTKQESNLTSWSIYFYVRIDIREGKHLLLTLFSKPYVMLIWGFMKKISHSWITTYPDGAIKEENFMS